MTVSVILPVHNNQDTVKRAIESVLNNIADDDELIIVLNGSTDNSKNIVLGYEVDCRVKIITSDPGRSRARNKGLQSAKGDFINFLDADDMMLPNHIEMAKNFLIENEEYDAYTDETLIVDDKSNRISIQYDKTTTSNILVDRNVFEIGAVMFRNRDISLFIEDLEYNEDHIFWIDNLLNHRVFFNSNFIGVHKFIDGNNTMIVNRKDMIGTQIVIFAVLKEKNMYEKKINLLDLIKEELKFLLIDSSQKSKLFKLVSSQFPVTMVFSKFILKAPLLGKMVREHYR